MNLLFRLRRRKSVFVGTVLLLLFTLVALVLDNASEVVMSEVADGKVGII